jgi:hypothetical protein
MNVSIEGSNPSFSARSRLRREARFTGETMFPPCAPFFGPPAIECLPHPRARSRVRQRRLGRFPLRAKRRGRDLNPRRTFQHVRDFQSRSLDHSDTSPGDAQRIHSREKARRRAASYHPRPEGWQSGRMRRSRKPLSVVRRIEGSNPSPSATYPLCSAFEAEERAPW